MSVKPQKLNAVILRIILSVSLLLIIAIVVAGFTFTHQMLTDYAISVGRKNIDAQSSETTLRDLSATEKKLADTAQIRKDASKLRLDDRHPEFTVREILTKIARRNDIDISITSGNTATDSTSAQPQTPPSGEATIPTPTTAQAAGNTFKLTISVEPRNGDDFTSATYKDFLRFLRDLEQNLPKIKISGIQVSGGGGSDTSAGSTTNDASLSQNTGHTVSVGSINLEIYVK